MSYPTQEQEERIYLDKFLEALGICPDRIDRGSDPPDLVMTIKGQRVAVEATGFHSAATGEVGHPRRSVEQEWDAIRETISERRQAHPELDSVNCRIAFKGLLVPPRRQHMAFADELISLVQDKADQVTDTPVQWAGLDGYPLLTEYLDEVALSRPGCYTTWDWDRNVASVGLSEEELKKIVLPKLEVQRSADVAENWLLVVSGYRLSQSMGVAHVDAVRDYGCLNTAIARGPFDKVYVFQYMYDRILQWDLRDSWVEVRPAQWAT